MSELKIYARSHIIYNIATNTCAGLDKNWKITKMGTDKARETTIFLSKLTETKNKDNESENMDYSKAYLSEVE